MVTENGWFAPRPSGTEDIYKIYTESFKGPEHLAQIQEEAKETVRQALESTGTQMNTRNSVRSCGTQLSETVGCPPRFVFFLEN